MKWISPALALISGLLLGALFFGASPEEEAERAHAAEDAEQSSVTASGAPVAESGSAGAPAIRGESEAISESWLRSLEGLNSFDRIGALHARLREVSPDQFETLMEELGEIGSSPASWQSRSMIAARWAESDPEGLAHYIQSQPRNQRWGLRSTLYSVWAKSDPDAALRSADGLPFDERRNAVSAIAGVLVERAPDRALALLEEHAVGSRNQHWSYRSLFQKWARSDPDGALAGAYQLEDKQARSAALIGVIADLAEDDPRAAIEWLDGQESGELISQTKGNLLNQILHEDKDAVMRYIESRGDPAEVRNILQQLQFSQLGVEADFNEIQSVMNWLGTVATGQTLSNKVGDIVKAMVQADPERARSYVDGMDPGAARLQAINAVAHSLVREDPAAAIDFFNSLDFKDERRRALSGLSWQLVQNNPELAKEFMLTSEDPLVQRALSHQLARSLAEQDRDSALDWAGQIKDSSARENALRNIVSDWVVGDPQAAFDYIGGLEEENTLSLYQNALNNFVREDPAEAVLWLEQLSGDGVLSDQAARSYQQAANAYVRHDPMAASEWIASLEAGENRDGAVSSLVQQIQQDDPEAGFRWAATMDDANQRGRSLEQSVRTWAEIDPAGAREAIEGVQIEAAEKEKLFDLLPDG
ncbi:MAG: hypothetical protein ACLFU4_05295 [Opitutales bacterium]